MGDKKAAFQAHLIQMGREHYGFPSTKTVYDAEGVPLKVGLVDDRIVPPFGEKFFRQVRTLQLQNDDILLCGYPKTGCHWTWEVLSMILKREAEISKTGKSAGFLEMAKLEHINAFPAPRILNTHVWYDLLPEQMEEKKTKIVYTVRNPKDTAVSYYNHHLSLQFMQSYNGTFKNWFELFMSGQVDYGSYFDYHLDWDKAIKEHPNQPVLVVKFEDMKENLPREIRKMCKFLGVQLEDQLVEDIAQAAGFDSMKTKMSLSNPLLRKGQVGDWKNWLTVSQSERIDAAMEKLKGTMFDSPRYTI